MSTVQLAGFGFTGYRSFYSHEPQLVSPLDKVHLVVGQNNSGKSNILRFVHDHLATLDDTQASWNRPSGLDEPNGVSNVRVKVSLGIASVAEALHARMAFEDRQVASDVYGLLEEVLSLAPFRRNGSDLIWFDFASAGGGMKIDFEQIRATSIVLTNPLASGRPLRLIGALSALTGSTYSSMSTEDALLRIIQILNVPSLIPSVERIDAIRQIVAQGDGLMNHSGSGLIKRLAELQNPRGRDPVQLAKFSEINQFVKSVLEDPTAQLHIPYTHDQILVESENLTLPLDHLGTGIHEVVIIAAAATVIENSLVCIEEPEIHLHPLLQRRLVRYLRDHTTNRYLVATHSAHMLDTQVASISHVTRSSRGSEISPAILPKHLAAISNELGYRASDLIQTNCVLWVEGPADRIYLRHWLSIIDPELLEGLHYTTMFYGGSLLSHLSADDPDIEDFISLRRLNRRMLVLLDSDRKRAGAKLNDTKKRVINELEPNGTSMTWTTAGYTIENYVPASLLKEAIESRFSGVTFNWTGERYENPLDLANVQGRKSPLPKAQVASEVVRLATPDTNWQHDVLKRARGAAHFIRQANDLPAVLP